MRAPIGLAFQVVDDVLDATADSATLGKTAGKDAADNKPTYVSILGLEPSRALAEQLRRDAHAALAPFGEQGTAAARAGGPDRAAEGINEPARNYQRTGRAAQAAAHPADAAGPGTAPVPARLGLQDGRPPVVQPGHGRTDHRAALRVQHAARPHRLGRRPPDLFAQDPHGPPRAACTSLRQLEWHVGLPEARRKRIRHLRHRALVDLDLGRAGHGAGRQDQGRSTATRSPSSATAP